MQPVKLDYRGVMFVAASLILPSIVASGTACTNPVFTTSDPNGGWSNGGYYIHNNMWNSAYGLGPETLYACSYRDWYVVSNQTNNAGAVKTYPNVHQDYDNVPINSFNTLTSAFAAESPHVGIYNVAYDIWTNGVATAGCTEFMIWTENYNQVPAGSRMATVSFGGRAYDVWKTSNNGYIAFVPAVVFTSGTVDLLEIFQWAISRGWLPPNSTVGQICFGVEIVSTAGANAVFRFTDFSITADTQTISEKAPTRWTGRTANLDNFPNPFNPSTEIRFVLPARAQPACFSLKIFNLRGRLIRTLARGETGPRATEHRFVWNGNDEQGRSSDAGVYPYCLNIGGKTAASGLMIMAK